MSLASQDGPAAEFSRSIVIDDVDSRANVTEYRHGRGQNPCKNPVLRLNPEGVMAPDDWRQRQRESTDFLDRMIDQQVFEDDLAKRRKAPLETGVVTAHPLDIKDQPLEELVNEFNRDWKQLISTIRSDCPRLSLDLQTDWLIRLEKFSVLSEADCLAELASLYREVQSAREAPIEYRSLWSKADWVRYELNAIEWRLRQLESKLRYIQDRWRSQRA